MLITMTKPLKQEDWVYSKTQKVECVDKNGTKHLFKCDDNYHYFRPSNTPSYQIDYHEILTPEESVRKINKLINDGNKVIRTTNISDEEFEKILESVEKQLHPNRYRGSNTKKIRKPVKMNQNKYVCPEKMF